MARGKRLEIVVELDRGRAAQTVNQHQRRSVAAADVVDVDPIDRQRSAFERGKLCRHDLSLSTQPPLSAPRGDRSGETEIGEDRTAHQVERDVEPADVQESERIRDKDTEHPEKQKNHAEDLAKIPGASLLRFGP